MDLETAAFLLWLVRQVTLEASDEEFEQKAVMVIRSKRALEGIVETLKSFEETTADEFNEEQEAVEEDGPVG